MREMREREKTNREKPFRIKKSLMGRVEQND
jgi:hypothetical protein